MESKYTYTDTDTQQYDDLDRMQKDYKSLQLKIDCSLVLQKSNSSFVYTIVDYQKHYFPISRL